MSTEEEKNLPGLNRFERRERAAADALRTLLRDLISDQYPQAVNATEPLHLQLDIRLAPGDNWALKFSPELREQILPQVEDAHSDWGTFQEGAVYHFKESRADLPECLPDSPTCVFAGYDAMGSPKWKEFVQVLLENEDPDVDQLYAGKKGRVLVRSQSGKALRAEQLSSYGRASKAYAILGQVQMGYCTLPRQVAELNGDERLAFSFQAVETRDAQGGFALRLNTIAGKLLPDELQDLFQDPRWQWIGNARRAAQDALESVQQEAERARAKKDSKAFQTAMKKVPRVLSRFAKSLERGVDQQGRRTRHSEERRQGRERPVHKAMEDLATARRQHAYFDLKKETLIVLGKHHRAHVFSTEGQQVTSFTIQADAVEMRVRTERWRSVNDAEWALVEAMKSGPVSEGESD